MQEKSQIWLFLFTYDMFLYDNIYTRGTQMEGDVLFRPVEEADAGLILTFIKALASHVNQLDDVSITEGAIRKWLFEKQKAEVIFAVKDDEEIGFALFFYTYSTFSGKPGLFLEDLFVLPAHRGKGYGKGLLRELSRTAVDRGCGKVEWHCLTWNQPSIDFYLSQGAEILDDSSVYCLSGEALRHMAQGE
jgi:GNAT superfamily N-acetyltransferase